MDFVLEPQGREDKKESTPSKDSVPQFQLVKDPATAIKLFDESDAPVMSFVTSKNEAVEIPPVPTDHEVYNYLMQNALILIDGGELALARTILIDIIKYEPKHCDALRWMGWCFWQEGDLKEAERWYVRLTEIRQTEEDLFELGDIRYKSENYPGAQVAWTEALKICGAENPLLFDIYKNLGNVATILADYDLAEEQYNKALTLRPGSDALQVNFGTLFFQRNDIIAALTHFKQAVEINPLNDRAWCGVSMAAQMMKDTEWAIESARHALEINPDNNVAKQILGGG